MSATTKERSPAPRDDAEVRHEGRERVVGDLRAGAGDDADERGLARRSGTRRCRRRRGASARGRDRAPPPAVPSCAKRGAWFVDVAKFMLPRPPLPPFATTKRVPASPRSAITSPVPASFTTVPGGTRRSELAPVHAVHVGAEPVAAALRLVDADVAVVEQRRELRVDEQHDVAAVAAVAAGRSAARDELLAPPRHGAVAAVAGLHVDADFVDELHPMKKRRGPWRPAAPS